MPPPVFPSNMSVPEVPIVPMEEEDKEDHSSQFISLRRLIQYDDNQEFKTFKQKQDLNSTYTLYFFIFQSVLRFWRCGVVLTDGAGAPLALNLTVLLRFPVFLFLGGYYVYLSKKMVHSTVFNQSDGTKLMKIGNALVMSQAILEGAMMMLWAFTIGDCEVSWCQADKNIIPLTRVIYILAVSIANPIFYGCHSTKVSLSFVCVSFASIIVVAVQRHIHRLELLSLAVLGIIMFYTIAKYETQVLSNYISYSKFESALRVKVASENEEYLLKIQTEEMRHMIGNVAHDLRTPLQAFQSEIELLRETIKNDDTTPEKQKSQLDSIKQLGLICHFMNMTINRSIDFTKASSDIKLNPSIESVNFSDTMSWAVGCMVTTQEEGTVPIELEPIPAAIHNHIYTDKQWLMENMLCLLSNAQKFTTEGAITIRCTLHTMFKGSVVQPSRSSDSTVSATSTCFSSVAAAKKYSLSDRNSSNDDDCSVRSRGDLSSWWERVSDYVVDFGATASTAAVTPISWEAPPMLMIEIEDSGIGITKENREKLFQPFAQAQHRTGGTGLGLYSLSKRLESLGGNCGVEGRSDGASGSCFWISIPYRPDRSVSQPPPNHRLVRTLVSPARVCSPRGDSRNDVGQLASMMSGYISHDGECADEQSVHEPIVNSHRGLRILLVDDSALIRKATSRSLINEGYSVEVARQGAECLKMLEAARATCKSGGYGFDVVLMDMQMPVMDGLEATRRIRALEASGGSGGGSGGGSAVSRHITIIGVSAHTEGEARAERNLSHFWIFFVFSL